MDRCLRVCAFIVAVSAFVLPVVPLRAASDLTGTYMADDGGIYYVQQAGNILWWVGMSLETELPADQVWHRGLTFTNVFRGTIVKDGTIVGEWSNVSRGLTLSSGTLKLAVGRGDVKHLARLSQTGGFSAIEWTQTAPLDDLKFNSANQDIFSRFDAVHKNNADSSSLHDNLKPYRDATVVYGHVTSNAEKDPPNVSYTSDWGHRDREFAAFSCTTESPEDGDLAFNLKIDTSKLERDFFLTGWGDRDPSVFSLKFNDPQTHTRLSLKTNEAFLHVEAIMYGRVGRCFFLPPPFPRILVVPDVNGGAALLPGWSDLFGNSVLVNGRPMNGLFDRLGPSDPTCSFAQPCPFDTLDPSGRRIRGVQIGSQTIIDGTYARVTGTLVLDCGHGFGSPCYDDPTDSTQQNQEIHPIYSIEIIGPPLRPEDKGAARPNLTGAWGGSDGSTYYLRQIGNTVWWLGQPRDRQPMQRGNTYPMIEMLQIAPALFAGDPVCPPPFVCWAFSNVFNGIISDNKDQSATIQGQWAGVPQSASAGSTGGSMKFNVDANRKTITPATSPSIFPDRLEKLYEPEDTTPPRSVVVVGTTHQQTGRDKQHVVTSTAPVTITATDADSGVQNISYRVLSSGKTPPAYTSVLGSSASFTLSGRDGWYSVEAFATDNAGNDETKHLLRIYLHKPRHE